MVKRCFSLFIILIAISINSIAQKNLSAREILDRTTEQMQKNGSVSATFATTLFQGTTPTDTILGTIDILGEKYVMKTLAVCTWFNGRDQWTLMHDNPEVSLVSPTQEELQTCSPMAFMSIYRKGFNMKAKNASLRGRKVWEVTLTPQKRNQEPSAIVVSIDQENFTPLCLRIKNNGDWTRISIAGFKMNTGLSADHFNFPLHDFPQHDVIDMR